MDVSDITASAVVQTIDRVLEFVLIGDFNLEDVRDILTEEDWIEGEYEGVEIWTGDLESAIAFIDNMIVIGYDYQIEGCIRIYKDEEPSMYDNADAKAVADKLPVVRSCLVATGDYSPPELEDILSEIEYLAYSMGLSNENRGDEVMDISAWFKFNSGTSAEAAMEDVEDLIDTGVEGYASIRARLNGQFIEITGEMEIP